MEYLHLRDIGEDLSDSEDDEVMETVVVRTSKRYIRDGNNPFECYNDKEVKRRFRFNKESIMYGVLPEIEEGLTKTNNRGLPVPPAMQLLICLRFYATASFQLLLSVTVTVSQPTISRIVFRVSALLASLLNQYIKMPSIQELRNENRWLFKKLGQGNGAIGLPGIDGTIDCTHIRLVDTRFQDINEIYRNRKGYFSLNVQTVGPRMEFLDIVPEWPGSEHDSRIFKNSRIYMKYANAEHNGILVGDAGYSYPPFLLTPIANPTTDEQMCYNNIHGRTRRIVERTYGVWKRRFRCLTRGLTTKLLCSTTIVVACAVLHNMSLIFSDILPEDDEPIVEEEVHNNQPHWQPMDSFAARVCFIEHKYYKGCDFK